MELYAMHGQRLVAHTHDLAVVGPCGEFQAVRHRIALNHQRVVARGGERAGQACEYAVAVMVYLRGLAVHQLPGVDDAPSESLAYALVAEAHAENGNLACETLDRLYRDTRLVRRAWAGRNHQMLRVQRGDLFGADFVVAMHHHIFAEFSEI